MGLLKNIKFCHVFIQSMVVVKNMKFGHVSQKNVFENILETKKSFEDYKIEKLKKSKNWDFSKGVSPWFGSKM